MSASKKHLFAKTACWVVPPVFLLWLWWPGLWCWFQQDDFAWLTIRKEFHDFPSFLNVMFGPMAQGTIRPWSERGFFLLFQKLFGADALPFRIAVFATQIVNLWLLSFIAFRLTGKRLAALAAPLIWTANTALTTPLCWTSSYNEIQCAFFLLAAFSLHLTGRFRLRWVVFVLGFGALELNIVYPALILAYVLISGATRPRLLGTVPLFAVSIAYFILHGMAVPAQTSGPYAMHFGKPLASTLWTYWNWSFLPAAWGEMHLLRHISFWWLGSLFLLLATVYTFSEYRRRNLLPLFALAWFGIALAPFLPLTDHKCEYYLTVPAIGLSLLFAQSLSNRNRAAACIAWAACLLYLSIQIPSDRFSANFEYLRSQAVRNLVLGARQATALHPSQSILLENVSTDLYSRSVAHAPFYALDIPGVYLSPETAAEIHVQPPVASPEAFVLPEGPVLHALSEDRLAVYSAAGGRLQNITSAYEARAAMVFKNNSPKHLDVGMEPVTYLLGSTWYPSTGNARWMPARASLRMGGPANASEQLTLTGYCPLEQTRLRPLVLVVSVDGKELLETTIRKPETSFSRSFHLPSESVGKPSMEVTLQVNRTISVGTGGPPLGLLFGQFDVR